MTTTAPGTGTDGGTATEVTALSSSGALRGRRDADVCTFLGIPYATPPTGTRRFQPPAEATPWTGVRDAGAFGPPAPQNSGASNKDAVLPGGSSPWSEDCLTLNVWTPDLTGKRPVLLWLHGGGFFAGSSGWTLTEGTALARQHDVTIVSVNHRLGLFGYLHLAEALGPDYQSSGNAGLLDIVAALKWVRDNIAGFGGDPDCVTLFGQSGGAAKILGLMAMPAASGLFHRAVLQSGTSLNPAMGPGQDAGEAAAAAGELLGLLGIEDHPERLLAMPAGQLVAAQAELMKGWTPGGRGGRSFRPVVDGAAMPHHPAESLSRGDSAQIPVLIGSTLDETTIFLYDADQAFCADPQGYRLAESDLRSRVAAQLADADAAPDVIAHYRSTHPGASNLAIYTAITSDFFRLGAVQHAEWKIDGAGAPVYAYLFQWRSPLFGGVLGAAHCFELPFIFGTMDRAKATASGLGRTELAAAMSGAWAQFARTGQPGIALTGPWPSYGKERRATMNFDVETGVTDDPFAADREFWVRRGW